MKLLLIVTNNIAYHKLYNRCSPALQQIGKIFINVDFFFKHFLFVC